MASGPLPDPGKIVMKLPRRKFLQLAAGAAALPAVAGSAYAQSYPTRPLRLVLGYPAGGSTDLVARIMGAWLAERLGQSVRRREQAGRRHQPGGPGGGQFAARRLHAAVRRHHLRHQRDALQDSCRFDFLRDIVPVAGLVDLPFVHGGRSVGAGQDRRRVHRLRQGQSRQGQHGLVRHRHDQPSGVASCSRR